MELNCIVFFFKTITPIKQEETVHDMAVAVNKTLSHHLQKLLFFFGTTENPFKNAPQPSGMNIVVHSETEPVKVLYQTLYYLYQHYQDIYDWFFIATDKTYVAGYKGKRLPVFIF